MEANIKKKSMDKYICPATIFSVLLIGGAYYFSSPRHTEIGPVDALAAEFERLSSEGNSTCSAEFADSIMAMPDNGAIKGSCCSAMNLHRYSEQIEGLKKYEDIPEIPRDPYNVEAALAKELMSYYDLELTADEQKLYDHAMEHSHEKGPCCCKCWRWYVYGGLAKKLIRERGFTAEQIIEVWNLSDGCGGDGDHGVDHHMD